MYVDLQFFSKESTCRLRESAQFVTATRICYQPDSQSEHCQTRSGISFSNSRENAEFRVICSNSRSITIRKSHVIGTVSYEFWVYRHHVWNGFLMPDCSWDQFNYIYYIFGNLHPQIPITLHLVQHLKRETTVTLTTDASN